MRLEPKKSRFTELDALRGIAAVVVMFFHYSKLPGYNLPMLNIGVTGVDLFFLISGFVIFMTLERVRTAKDFIISRLSRIYPSYLVMMLVTIIFLFFFGNGTVVSAKEAWGNVTMLQPFFRVPYIDDVYWTLVVEIEFYAFMLLVFLAGRIKQIEWIGFVFVILVVLFHLIVGTYWPDSRLYIVPRSLFPFMCHFCLFLGGIVFYKMREEGPRWYRHCLLLICLLTAVFLFDSSGKAHFFITRIQYTGILLVYFAVFYLFVFGKLRFISIKPLIFLGSISYCLYLVHGRAGVLLHQYITARYAINPALLTLLIMLLMIALATTVTNLVEKPAIAFIRKRWKPTPAAAS